MLQACLNGSRSKAEHAQCPVTPDELAAEADAAVRAGAEMLHIHPRDGDGAETLDGAPAAAALLAVQAVVDVPIGVSTGAWIEPDVAARFRAISEWEVLPDFASVNIHEEGAVDLIRLLVWRGIAVEAGVWSADAARALVDGDVIAHCTRVLIEVMDQELAAARRSLTGIEEVLPTGLSVLLHGQDRTAWVLVEEAARRGNDTRIGLEDVLVLPDGTMAGGNGDLVTAARRLMGGVSGG